MIRLLLTESDAVRCEILHANLEAAGLEVLGAVADGTDLLIRLASVTPMVVLLDLSMTNPDAFILLSALRSQYPQLRILAHSELTSEQYIARAFDLGAHGYIVKTAPFAELLHALEMVVAGRPFLCSSIGLALLEQRHVANPAAVAVPHSAMGLSKRELEVLVLVADGLTNAEIALKLFTSKRTVETHRQNIMDKTQTRNTAALIKLAMHQGLLPK